MSRTNKTKPTCPKCHGRNIADGKGKKMVCINCHHEFQIVTDREAREKRDRAIDNQKKYQARKWLKKQTKRLRNSPTGAEAEFGRRLAAKFIPFISQWSYDVEGFMGICDFLLPNHNVIIEVDGGYHLEEEQQLKDAEKDFICEKLLKKRVLRITNKQAMFLSMDKILVLIENCKKGL